MKRQTQLTFDIILSTEVYFPCVSAFPISPGASLSLPDCSKGGGYISHADLISNIRDPLSLQ